MAQRYLGLVSLTMLHAHMTIHSNYRIFDKGLKVYHELR